MFSEATKHESLLPECESVIAEIYARCIETAPNFAVSADCFNESITKTINKYIQTNLTEKPGFTEIKEFLQQIQADDLFLALACANGNERAWWHDMGVDPLPVATRPWEESHTENGDRKSRR